MAAVRHRCFEGMKILSYPKNQWVGKEAKSQKTPSSCPGGQSECQDQESKPVYLTMHYIMVYGFLLLL